jgi:hypothetical protein
MANDGQIVFEVTADGKHAIADIKEITKAIQQESGKWDDAAKQSTDNIAANFSGMLKKLVAGFSAVKIGKALLDIGKDALEAASALEEVQNVVDVTFGSDANKIDKWAKNAGTQFGLSETQAKKFTSTLGAMMKSSGIAGKEITEMSTDLAGLAADMASFYNLDFDTAFQKIRSGISGETEPLKQLGINMSVVNLEAFALSKGITKAFNDMSQGEQTMLRYQYIMQATSDAQGDFARTSDGYANSMRTLETNVERIKTALGSTFIDIAANATTAISGFLDMLIPEEKQKTVLDDFAEIDLKTEDKLANIKATAEQARLLTDELDKINRTKVDEAGKKVDQFAKDLGNIDLDQSKANVVKDFVSTLSENIGVVSALRGEDAEGAKAWLEEIGTAADSLNPDDAEGWEKLLNSIKEGLPGLENTDFGQSFFSALSEGFSGVSSSTSVLDWVIDNLGAKTEKTAEEQAYWLEVCKNLTKTIPGLSSIINTETGEIKGGTQAVKDYIQAWEDGQTRLALLGALEQKESAIASHFADIPEFQLNAALAEHRVREQRKKMDELRKKYGFTQADNERIIQRVDESDNIVAFTDAENEWNAAVMELSRLEAEARSTGEAYQAQKEALEEAKQALKEYREAIEEQYGSVEKAIELGVEWSEELKESAKVIVDNVLGAMDDLGNYYEKVLTETEKAVNATVDGFKRLDKITSEEGKARQKISNLAEEQAKYVIDSPEWKALQAQINDLNASLTNRDNMYSALESQQKFLQDYISNLEKAQSLGLSDELLAMLSDGTEESAAYLAALVSDDPTGKTAKEIDELYKQIQESKKTLSTKLTDQQLTVDQTFTDLQEKAKEAVAALDMAEMASDNAGKTVSGLAQGIKSHVPEVESAVNEIEAQLNRLSGWGISIDLGSFGNLAINAPSASGNRGTLQNVNNGAGTTIASNEKGLDYVPFDGYLSVLHAGESILTAEEARIWRQFKDGGSGVDYDTMGGLMRDNIKPGGNVYLDGRVVGSVISDQQGRVYRQMQRSGWQS